MALLLDLEIFLEFSEGMKKKLQLPELMALKALF